MSEQEHVATWAGLLDGVNCPLCGPQPAVNDYKFTIAALSISTLYLAREQRFRGYCFLVFDPYHATDLAQLPADEYGAFLHDLRRAGLALRSVFQPDHMNYECLGNGGPHLHWHLFPRYRTDPRWGHPVWADLPPAALQLVTLDDPEYHEMVERIRAALTTFP